MCDATLKLIFDRKERYQPGIETMPETRLGFRRITDCFAVLFGRPDQPVESPFALFQRNPVAGLRRNAGGHVIYHLGGQFGAFDRRNKFDSFPDNFLLVVFQRDATVCPVNICVNISKRS